MTGALKTLIRVRDWRVDQKSRVVTGRLRHLHDLENDARALERQVTAEQAIAKSSPDEAGMAYAGYARRVLGRRAQLDKAIAEAEAAVSAARDDLAQAFRDLKTVEIAQAHRQRRDAAEAERRDTIALDEIALQGHRRRSLDR